MKYDRKKDAIIYIIFFFIGLIFYIFKFPKLENLFNIKESEWASFIIIFACMIFYYVFIFSCDFLTKEKFACILAINLNQLMLIINYLTHINTLKYIIIILSIVLIVILIFKVKKINAINIISKQELYLKSKTSLFKLLNFNIFANSLCLVSLIAILYNVISINYFVIVLTCFIATLLTILKNILSQKFYTKQNYCFEICFINFEILLSSLNTIFSGVTDKGIGNMFLYIVVMMSAYYIFERPYILDEIKQRK